MSAGRIGFAFMGVACVAYGIAQLATEGFPAGGVSFWAAICSFKLASMAA